MSKLARDHRDADLVKIHVARRQANLSDGDYRTILQAQGGAASSKDLDHAGRQRVIAYLERTYKLTLSTPKKPFGQAEKIAWLWAKIGKAGGLRDPSAQALLAFIARTAGMEVSHPKLLPLAEASKVIEALKAMLDRAKRAAKASGEARP